MEFVESKRVTVGVLTFATLMVGCPSSGRREAKSVSVADADGLTAVEPQPIAAGSTSSRLLATVDETLRDNLLHRHLDVTIHGAWQVMHGILAYGDTFPVDTPEGVRPALAYLLDGGTLAGFEPMPGDRFGERTGLRMVLQPATKVGQGHRDQWLAIFAQCGLPIETTLTVAGRGLTIEDWLRQAEWDVPLNLEREFSWTLIGLLAYRGTDHRWPARDGNDYNIEGLLKSELRQDLSASVCGGTHRLNAIAMTLAKRRAEGRPIEGVWADAEAAIDAVVATMRSNQNPDGSYSLAYFHRPGWARDWGEQLGTTGHVLESAVLAEPPENLSQPWIERSVIRLTELLEQCRDVDLECGALYHALHGLQEYQARRRASEALRAVGMTNDR